MSLVKFVRPQGIAIYDPNELQENAVMPTFKRICVVSNTMAQEFRQYYFIVVVHGSPTHVMGQDAQSEKWTAQDFYNQVIGESVVRDAIYNQRKAVFLMSCQTGQAFASEASKLLGAPVLAPDKNSYASGITPGNYITIRIFEPTGKWMFHIPNRGHIELTHGPLLLMPEAVSMHKMFWK